jgi:ribosomal protein S15P/S13E
VNFVIEYVSFAQGFWQGFRWLLMMWKTTDSFGHAGLGPEIPEDLYHLIKKAVAVRKHLERNRKDKDSKFRLILIESRVHRLARYYKRTKKLPPNWK